MPRLGESCDEDDLAPSVASPADVVLAVGESGGSLVGMDRGGDVAEWEGLQGSPRRGSQRRVAVP